MQRLFLTSSLLAGTLAAGCSDIELEAINYPATLSGEYCTESATTFGVPIRILLVIDTSRSMELNDPNGYRASAAAELISGFSGDDNVSFGLIEFNTSAARATDGFMRDPTALGGALGALTAMEGFTNYLDALGLAEAFINDDIAAVAADLADLEANGESTHLARPWYFVVFLSDGIPRMPGGVLQETSQILWRVGELVDLPPEASGLTLHTAFLGAEDDAQRAAAEALLSEMASVGGGSYTSFARGEEIDFSVFDFRVKRLFDIKQLVLYNRNAILGAETVLADSDGDGIDDVAEERLGTDPVDADSDGDGCSDGFERRAGLDPTGGVCPCAADSHGDTDGDGLTDCEELFLDFDPQSFDSDGDLFPDALELRVGTNAADSADQGEDLDFDGVATGVEIRHGTNPVRADEDMHDRFSYRYGIERTVRADDAQICYQITVDNVTIADTLGSPSKDSGLNEIVIEVIESPEDAAEEIFALRRLVIPVAFRKHRGERLEIAQGDFVEVNTQQLGINND